MLRFGPVQKDIHLVNPERTMLKIYIAKFFLDTAENGPTKTGERQTLENCPYPLKMNFAPTLITCTHISDRAARDVALTHERGNLTCQCRILTGAKGQSAEQQSAAFGNF